MKKYGLGISLYGLAIVIVMVVVIFRLPPDVCLFAIPIIIIGFIFQMWGMYDVRPSKFSNKGDD